MDTIDMSKKILLFDGNCNLCNNWAGFISKKGAIAKFQVLSLQSDAGRGLLKQYNLPDYDFNTVVAIIENKIYVKSRAVLYVLKDLGSFWKLFYFFIIIPRPILDFFYDIISKNRHRLFGKPENCNN